MTKKTKLLSKVVAFSLAFGLGTALTFPKVRAKAEDAADAEAAMNHVVAYFGEEGYSLDSDVLVIVSQSGDYLDSIYNVLCQNCVSVAIEDDNGGITTYDGDTTISLEDFVLVAKVAYSFAEIATEYQDDMIDRLIWLFPDPDEIPIPEPVPEDPAVPMEVFNKVVIANQNSAMSLLDYLS